MLLKLEKIFGNIKIVRKLYFYRVVANARFTTKFKQKRKELKVILVKYDMHILEK